MAAFVGTPAAFDAGRESFRIARPASFFKSNDRSVNKMISGKVKKWFSEKGFGFIARDDGTGDEFVHVNQLKLSGISGLEVGERVEFETAARGAKIEAINVRRIDSGAEVDGNTAPGWLNATAPVQRPPS